MVIGVLKLSMFLRGNRSLKGKRHVLKKIKDRVKSRFNVSIAEVEASNSWERFSLGITAVGDDAKFINSVIDKVRAEIENLYLGEIVESNFELINL